MNLRPGGKQAYMRDGWYIRNGQKITQSMVFPADHPVYPGLPKGMKEVIKERGLWPARGVSMECRICDPDSENCCATRILQRQSDFMAQRSLVRETIEERGHLCIFLPKYHCELNPIEFFWGAVKRYLRENCNYTYEGLKTNMPLALASVSISTIRKWFHRMNRWMEAYRGNLGAREAQFEVRKHSSRQYKSHRRVPEGLARQLDA
jgi:hypothetical protein